MPGGLWGTWRFRAWLPAIVVQNNVFNASNIKTVVVCSITSNLRHAEAPGNMLLVPGEANLQEQSVVNVSQVFTLDKRDLLEKVGSPSGERIKEVVSGINILLES